MRTTERTVVGFERRLPTTPVDVIPIARLLALHEQLFGPLDAPAKERMAAAARAPESRWRRMDGLAA
jgi:hypothetical protein